MPEGTTTVFGTDAIDDGEGELFPEASEPEAPEETPKEPEPTEPEPEPAEEPEEPQQPEAEAPADEPEQPQESYVGTYKTREDAEEGLRQVRTFATQQAQRAAEVERRYNELVANLQRYEPILRQMQAEGASQPLPDGMEPEEQAALQQFIDQRIQAGVQQAVQPLQEQRSREEEQRALQEIQEFRMAHPDSAGRDAEIAAVVSMYRTDDDGSEIFPPTRQNLEIAWDLASNPAAHSVLQTLNLHPDPEYVEAAKEIATNPALAKVVYAHPHVVDTEAGMAWAREQAQVPQVVTNATSKQQTETEEERKRAYVEKGEGRSEVDEAPGKKPVDPLEEALFDSMSAGERSVFGI